MALRFGPPPKAIHLDIGNSSTDDVLALLRSEAPSIREFAETDDALLVISQAAIG